MKDTHEAGEILQNLKYGDIRSNELLFRAAHCFCFKIVIW